MHLLFGERIIAAGRTINLSRKDMDNKERLPRHWLFGFCIAIALACIVTAIWSALTAGGSLILHPAYLTGMLLLLVSHWFSARRAIIAK